MSNIAPSPKDCLEKSVIAIRKSLLAGPAIATKNTRSKHKIADNAKMGENHEPN